MRAERDLDAILTYITQGEGAEHAEAAHRWYVGLREAILSLKNQPLRGVRVADSPGYRQRFTATARTSTESSIASKPALSMSYISGTAHDPAQGYGGLHKAEARLAVH